MQKLQSLIFTFIWILGGCRVSRSTLYVSKWRNSLGVPQLLCCYRAPQLAQLYQLFSTSYTPDWARMEAQVSAPQVNRSSFMVLS